MVDLIAEIPFGVGKIIAIPRFATVQLAALSHSRILVFVDVVGVLAALGGKAVVFSGAFQFLIKLWILSSDVQFSVAINRQHQTCGAFHKVISAHVQVGKSQLAVLDLGGSHKSVFLQNGQVIGIPAAVGENRSVPNGRAIGIGDFGIINHTRNTVRVFNRVCSVQIVHCTLQRIVAVAARSQIPCSVQIHFCQQDITEDTVVLHLVGIGVHGVGIFVSGNARGVCGVGLICIAAAKSDGYDALAGVDERAAAVGRSNVGAIIGVAQPNRMTVQRFRDFKGIRPLTQHRACRAGFGYIRPIAIVPAGSTTFHNDELALIALGIEQIVRTACIVTVVDDLVGAATLAFNFVLVISACRDIALPNHIPLKNLKLGIALDALLGFAVDFINADLDRPLIVLHFVVVAAICRNCNGLVAAQRAGRGIKAMRDSDLIVAECNIGKLRPRRGNSGIHHTLRLVLQLPDGRILGGFGSGIRFGLAGERSFLPGKRTGAGFGHLVIHRPCGRTVAAVEVKTVILRVTACGNGLRSGRGHLPAAAVHAAAGPAGRDGNDRAVHLFQRVQLNLVGVDSECQIKAAAGALRRSRPRSGIVLRFRNTRHIRNLSAARNFFTDQRHNLPRIPCGRVIDVGVVAVFPGLCICTVYQFFRSSNIGLRRVAVGIVFHDPLLGFIVKAAKDVRLFFAAFRIIFKACHNRTVIQHIQTQLAKTAPDVDLICIVVARRILAGFKAGYMREAVGGAALGLAVQAVAAAVGFLTVEPNQPCAALFGNTGDFASGIRRSRPCSIGGNAVIAGVGIHLCGSDILTDLYMDRF